MPKSLDDILSSIDAEENIELLNEVDDEKINNLRSEQPDLDEVDNAEAEENFHQEEKIEKIDIQDESESKEEPPEEIILKEIEPETVVEKPEEPVIAEKKINSSIFTLKGTRPWNTKEPYNIIIDDNKLTEDIEKLKTSFYYIESPEKKENVDRAVKDGVLKYLRNPTNNIF